MDHQTYLENVHKPKWVFTKSPRMFKTDMIEAISYCSWYNIFYVPYLIMLFYYQKHVYYNW